MEHTWDVCWPIRRSDADHVETVTAVVVVTARRGQEHDADSYDWHPCYGTDRKAFGRRFDAQFEEAMTYTDGLTRAVSVVGVVAVQVDSDGFFSLLPLSLLPVVIRVSPHGMMTLDGVRLAALVASDTFGARSQAYRTIRDCESVNVTPGNN